MSTRASRDRVRDLVPLLTLHQCARRLGLSYSGVYQLVSSGQLRATKLGVGRNSPLRVDPVDLEALIRRGQLAAALVEPAPTLATMPARTDMRQSRSAADECAELGVDADHEFVS